jgi:hypothetical protein
MAGPAVIEGGCLCGALRYQAHGAPAIAGFCCCADCRHVSGSGAIGFMMFPASALLITGAARQFRSTSIRGTQAVRNSCVICASLIYGGTWGADEAHTVYAGSLDDPADFHPTIAIFNRDRPAWMTLPVGLTLFETMPA